MSPYAAVDSAVSVDPTHPLIQPHTDHRRTTRSEPPFFVPVTASSDARGRLFRTGSNTPCHTSGTRHSYMIRNPASEWLSDGGPDAALRRCRLTLRILKKMTICPQGAKHKQEIELRCDSDNQLRTIHPAGRSLVESRPRTLKESILHHRRVRTELFGPVHFCLICANLARSVC